MKHSHIVSYHVIVISRHSIACTLSHTLSAQAYASIVSGHDADACKEARTHADACKEARTHADASEEARTHAVKKRARMPMPVKKHARMLMPVKKHARMRPT
jgi:hypothetical protein